MQAAASQDLVKIEKENATMKEKYRAEGIQREMLNNDNVQKLEIR